MTPYDIPAWVAVAVIVLTLGRVFLATRWFDEWFDARSKHLSR
ncbi:MAG TPA: hypothetical protein VKB50_11975 [Vicinamibacterales bacterium]|nr:hypothetical protein [Vicinamibacterales bacterium]